MEDKTLKVEDLVKTGEEKKAPEPKESRAAKRLRLAKQKVLDDLVLSFFTRRSACSDPEGEDAADLFEKYRKVWVAECVLFNKKRQPFKLRYEAFNEAVEYYLDLEKKNIAMSKAANKVKDFPHWLRRAHVWRTRPLTSLWYKIIALWRQEKWLSLWKAYYLSNVIK